ncbi:hypothetical protein KQX54_018977 [Cotesia glomerata]|uniref:Uncharacterized protein n=1 Tax=Cotesia glomerata TaxID=32391 RepID=A0AAV7IR92_COTGL|nr:hypothetical protein KQX54_018977 [Cotesia glomerata]
MNLIRKDREDSIGEGGAIAIWKGLPYEEVTLDNPIFNDENFEIVVTKITLDNKKLMITMRESGEKFKKIKNNERRKFIESINPKIPIKKIWNIIRNYDGGAKKTPDRYSKTDEEEEEKAMNKLASINTTTLQSINIPAEAGRNAI